MPPLLISCREFDRRNDLDPAFEVGFGPAARESFVGASAAFRTAEFGDLPIDGFGRTGQEVGGALNQAPPFSVPRLEARELLG